MSARDTRLMVFAHLPSGWAPCGQLQLTEEGPAVLASSFAYGLNYGKRPDALEVDPVSLSLQHREQVLGQRLLPAAGLTEFGGIRDAAPDAWGRRVIEAKLKVPANSLPESQYLLHAGSERVGALDVRTDIHAGPTPGAAAWHHLEHLMEAAGRIEEGLPVPTHLDAIFQDGTALGGARPKASVRDDQGVLWLAKFASRSDRFDVPGVESACLRLAGLAGMRVPIVQTRRLGQRRVMLVQRFDRYRTDPAGPEQRMGFVSGLTLLGCEETDSRTRSYTDLTHAVRRHVHPPAIRQDNAELFRRMVFNIFISNDDDHLRNHAFVRDPRTGGWCLSPLYDVLPRPSLATERYQHLGVGPQGRLATLDNALAAHEAFTLSRGAALSTLAEVWAVVREWRSRFEEWGVAPTDADAVAPAFRHVDHIASPALRKAMP